MTIVVEDGSGLTNSNSYVSLADARAYALARGITLSASDSTVEILVVKSIDYLESLRDSYKGYKSNELQALQWPRTGVSIDGYSIAGNFIPEILKNAQKRLIMDINADLDPLSSGDGSPFVLKDKIGPIETVYSEAVSTSGLPLLRAVEASLAPLLMRQGLLSVERA